MTHGRNNEVSRPQCFIDTFPEVKVGRPIVPVVLLVDVCKTLIENRKSFSISYLIVIEEFLDN